MVLIAALSLLAVGELVAYDEFDGRSAGFENAWREGHEEGGSWVTTEGNSWRALTHPVEDRTIWFAVTMRMREPITGYASVVPAASGSTQFSELGFNSSYGKATGLWTAGIGPVFGPMGATTRQTFLQRYDLADGYWSAWSLPGLGEAGFDATRPLVNNAPLAATKLSYVYLTKGSPQALEIERIAVATTAEAALRSAPKGTVAQKAPPAQTHPDNPSFEVLRRAVRKGDRIAFFGDSITWQGGFIDILERELRGTHVALLRRGINGAKSGDILKGVSNLFNQNQRPFREVLKADKPSLVVLMVGMNDAWHPTVTDPTKTYAENLQHLLDGAEDADVPMLVCTTTGIEPAKVQPDFSATLAKLAKAALGLRASFLKPAVVHCNVLSAFAGHLGNLTYDGVHLTAEGNSLVAGVLADSISRALLLPVQSAPAALVPFPERSGFRVNYALGKSFRVVAPESLRLQADLIQARLGKPSKGAVPVRLTMSRALANEAYSIKRFPTEIIVEGGSARAIAWAGVTLCQAVATAAPLTAVNDKPTRPFRGLLLDVARQWHSVKTIKQVILLCSLYKINYLQLHLTDDQSFTFPSRAFPELATVGRSYTLDELKGLQLFAEARGVTIIPELEMPGHGAQMVSKRPDLFRAHEKHHATLNFAKPEALTALDTLISEVTEAFPKSPYVHIGGDEADLTYVHENPDFQAAFKREGVSDSQELYRTLLNRMNRVVRKRGKTMLVWEGFGPGGKVPIDKSIVVMNFESAYYPPDQMAAARYTMINTSWRPLYVVNDRNWSPEEIYGWNDHFWHHFVESMPSGRGIQVEPSAKILGGMMCAWEQPES